jgi:hypothetical protein
VMVRLSVGGRPTCHVASNAWRCASDDPSPCSGGDPHSEKRVKDTAKGYCSRRSTRKCRFQNYYECYLRHGNISCKPIKDTISMPVELVSSFLNFLSISFLPYFIDCIIMLTSINRLSGGQ